MKLSVPLAPVYYFELTPRGPRLLYYLPRGRLAGLVRKREVRNEALLDFPYGLEVEVSEEEFGLIREEYGFTPPLSPRQIWAGFRGFWLHSRHALASISGLIDARRLEAYARQVSKAITKLSIGSRHEIPQHRHGDSLAATNAERSGLWVETTDQLLMRMRPKDANPELEMNEQTWSRVRMTRGLSAELVFVRAQFPERRV